MSVEGVPVPDEVAEIDLAVLPHEVTQHLRSQDPRSVLDPRIMNIVLPKIHIHDDNL